MKSPATFSPRRVREHLEVLRQVPIPVLGMAPHGWEYSNPALLARAQRILISEGIVGKPYEAAPMVFWYRTPDDEIHCHDWTDQPDD